MEKYFLKISSLAIATIPMVAMVACSEDNSKKCSEVSPAKPLTLKQVKAKFVNANSTKEKIDINLPAVNTTIDPVDLYSVIGYEVPTGIPDTFTITYKLSTNWKTGADDEKFDIEVLITQGAVKETKIFTIIAKDYHFTQARAKIIRKVTSTKMKIEIGDLTISDVQKDDFDKIGYETPTNLPPSVNVKSYTIASKWKKGADANKFDIKLILKKRYAWV